MDRRAHASEETRKRIVEATYALHAEKGVAATTFRDIATRADVGIGTVYHHFPSYEDVIRACGQHAMMKSAPPSPEMFDGMKRLEDRVRTLVREMFASYERLPAGPRVRAERAQFVAVDEAFRGEEEMRRALIDAALRGSRADERVKTFAFSLLDMDVYANLRAAGFSEQTAVQEIGDALIARMKNKRRSQ